jgi:hypothetical protein
MPPVPLSHMIWDMQRSIHSIAEIVGDVPRKGAFGRRMSTLVPSSWRGGAYVLESALHYAL